MEANHDQPGSVEDDARRTPRTTAHRHLPDLVYGTHDSIVTTFAIAPEVKGAQLSNQAILAPGFRQSAARRLLDGSRRY